MQVFKYKILKNNIYLLFPDIYSILILKIKSWRKKKYLTN